MHTNSTTSFGILLREHRRAAGLTQAELAERAGLSWRGVNDLERGVRRTPHRDTLARLVTALGLTGEERAALEAAARPPLASAPTVSSVAAEQEGHDHLPILPTLLPGREREQGAVPDAETRPHNERLKAKTAFALIGRDAEWQTLIRAWARASHGQAAMVMLSGEAGIGKTRLTEELVQWADRQGISVATAHCYTAEGRLTYAPVVEWLRTASVTDALRTLPKAWHSALALLLPELQTERLSSAGQQTSAEPLPRQRLFEAMARTMLGASQPLLLVIDDLHWCDRDTLEWLHYLLRFDPRARLLVVGTLRREEAPGDHPVAALLSQLGYADLLTEIPLRRLDALETVALAASLMDRGLRDDQAAHLYAETEGNPLFVVETVRAGTLSRDRPDAPHTSPPGAAHKAALPPRIQALIAARLSGLSIEAREVAGIAAAIGRTFRLDMLDAASETDEEALVRALDGLLQHGIVRDQGSNIYDFSHDRIRDAAYEGLSTARRSLIHRRIAAALEALHADDLDTVSGQIATHYDRAGLAAQAIAYYQRAAQVAHRLAAVEEAISHLNRALALLRTQPESPARIQLELALQVALGAPLVAARGYAAPELEHAFNRAYEICQQIGETPRLFQVLWGLGRFYLVRPRLDAALTLRWG